MFIMVIMEQQQQFYEEALLWEILYTPSLEHRYRLLPELYWKLQSRRTPLVVRNRVYFLFWGSAQTVAVIGDWNGWTEPEMLQRVAGTNCFVLRKVFPESACVQYKFIVDGQWIQDPLNGYYSPEGFGVNSELKMPRFSIPEEIGVNEITGTIPPDVVPLRVRSEALGEDRTIWIYPLVPDLDLLSDSLPVIMFHDGEESLTIGGYHRILERMFQRRLIPPLVAVFVPPRQRNWEYEANAQFMRFCAEEVLSYVQRWGEERRLVLRTDAVCSVGASLAGLLSTLLVLHYPHQFRAFIAQSPAYWRQFADLWNDPNLQNLQGAVGILQTGTIADAQIATLLFFRRFRQFTSQIVYHETHQGHTWGQWRRMLPLALQSWWKLWSARG